MVDHLHDHGVPIALATGSAKREFDTKTGRHIEMFSKFLHRVFASDDPQVKHGKPAPDCFLVAARRFSDSPTPEKVVFKLLHLVFIDISV